MPVVKAHTQRVSLLSTLHQQQVKCESDHIASQKKTLHRLPLPFKKIPRPYMICPGQSFQLHLLPTSHPSPSAKQPPHCAQTHQAPFCLRGSLCLDPCSPEPQQVGSFSSASSPPPPQALCHQPVLFSCFLVYLFSACLPSPIDTGGIIRPTLRCTPSLQPRAHIERVPSIHGTDKCARGPPGSGRSRPPRHQRAQL